MESSQEQPHDKSSRDGRGLEDSLTTNPWHTICSLFWGNRLAALPHTSGSHPISFSSLWPTGRSFIEIYSMAGMDKVCYDVVKLLLASGTLGPLATMLAEGTIQPDIKFHGNVTLPHLLCVLLCEEGVELLNRQSHQNGLWHTKDNRDRGPLDVCFSPDFSKSVRKSVKGLKSWFPKKPVPSGLEISPDIKQQIFSLASAPEGFYDFAILLQTYMFDVNTVINSDGNNIVHEVVLQGLSCLPHLFYLIRNCNADIHMPNRDGLTPLSLSAKIGDEKLAEVLICVFDAGVNSADKDMRWTALHYAARYNHPKLVSMLLERGADACKEDSSRCVPAILAQKYGATECHHLLIYHGEERDDTLAREALEGTLKVEQLLESDIYLVTRDGFTLLMKAVLGNKPAIVQRLLNCKGCPIDFRQMKLPDVSQLEDSMGGVHITTLPACNEQTLKTALHIAAENGFTQCVSLLIDHHANPAIEDHMRYKPLHYAVQAGHKECVKLLVVTPASLTGLHLAMSLAEANGRADIINIIQNAMRRRKEDVIIPKLFEIAASGDSDLLYQLLEDGDDVNPYNDIFDWPLIIAAGYGYLDIVKMLYEHGGDVVKCHRLHSSTPLHMAAKGGHVEVVRFFLNNFLKPPPLTSNLNTKTCFDINEKNAAGATPLELAATQGHMNVVRLLLEHGAVTTLPDSNNRLLTCQAFCGIQFLLESKRKEQMGRIVKALIDHVPLKDFTVMWKGPSDFNLRDSHGDTALMVAAQHANKPDVVEYLLQSATLFTADMRIKWSTNNMSTESPKLNRSLDASFQSDTEVCRPRSYSMATPRPMTAMDFRLKKQGHAKNYGYGGKTDGSSDEDFLSSGEYLHKPNIPYYKPLEPIPHSDTDGAESVAYGAVGGANDGWKHEKVYEKVLNNPGPCTQSGVVCLTSLRDGRSCLHRAVEGNKYKVIPLLLSADPRVANVQDKQGLTALHLACQLQHRHCITALLSSKCAVVDATLRNSSNSLAEDLALRPNLKRKVAAYRQKQLRSNPIANRPLPKIPSSPPRDTPPSPSTSPYKNHTPTKVPSATPYEGHTPMLLPAQQMQVLPRPPAGAGPYQMVYPVPVYQPSQNGKPHPSGAIYVPHVPGQMQFPPPFVPRPIDDDERSVHSTASAWGVSRNRRQIHPQHNGRYSKVTPRKQHSKKPGSGSSDYDDTSGYTSELPPIRSSSPVLEAPSTPTSISSIRERVQNMRDNIAFGEDSDSD